MWICPTFKRPERLSHLAMSWATFEKRRPLKVRVWKDDPRIADYFAVTWPRGWELYVSEAKGAGDACRELWEKFPDEGSYGFIGDDVVLRTQDGLNVLERAAGRWGIAYPNDTIQRHRLCTHFCVGGDLTRALGWWILPGLHHHYIDVPLFHVGINLGLLRYCPDVIFHHMHFLANRAERDDTYKDVWGNGETDIPTDPAYQESAALWRLYYESNFKRDLQRVYTALVREYEKPQLWAKQDEVWKGAENGIVCSHRT